MRSVHAEQIRHSQRDLTGGVRGTRQGACPPSADRCWSGQARAHVSDGAHGLAFHAPDLERELLTIDREEKKLVVEIKAAARNGNEKGAKLLAKSLVRLRGQRTKVLASAAQLRGVRVSIGVRPPPSAPLPQWMH